MKQERIGPAHKDEVGILFTPANNPAVSTTRTKTQRNAERGTIPPMPEVNGGSLADWKAMLVAEGYFLHVEILDPLGPVERIRTSAGIPLVPTRWKFPGEAFDSRLLPPGKDCSGAVIKWALNLRAMLERVAIREQQRFDRLKASYRNGGAA